MAKTVDGVETRYTLDPAAGLTQVLVESTGGQQTAYLYGADLLAQYDSGTWAYHLNDGLGSVRQLVDAAGQVVASYSFDPFGVPLGESGGQPYGFTGEQWDAEVELLYLRARYYDANTGRFITRDRWPGDTLRPQGLNGYSYVENNPANQIDPSGQASIHSEVVLRYALEYGFQPEYTIPTMVPPNKPSWARWGWRVDLVDWVNYEIYEVEAYNAGAPYATGHGPAQVRRYLDALNGAYGGVGIAFVNKWRPGARVFPMDFTTWGGFVAVHAQLQQPGVIVFQAQWTQKAYDTVVDVCTLLAWWLILKGAGGFEGQLEPQPGTAPGVFPYWLPPGELPPPPTPSPA